MIAKSPDLSPAQFARLAKLARKRCGLILAADKRPVVSARLRGRLVATASANFDSYFALIDGRRPHNEWPHTVSALTTNVSRFFREPHHFDILTRQLLPQIKLRLQSGQPVRIWSAGCANGQETYSLAITLLRAAPELATQNLRILGTDIDRTVVNFAKAAIYRKDMLKNVSRSDLERFMVAVSVDKYRITKPIRDLVRFRELNLLDPWPMQHKMDVIFCRNVLIYMDAAAQAQLVKRFYNALRTDGLLCLGHAERMTPDCAPRLFNIGHTAFLKQSHASQTVAI